MKKVLMFGCVIFCLSLFGCASSPVEIAVEKAQEESDTRIAVARQESDLRIELARVKAEEVKTLQGIARYEQKEIARLSACGKGNN